MKRNHWIVLGVVAGVLVILLAVGIASGRFARMLAAQKDPLGIALTVTDASDDELTLFITQSGGRVNGQLQMGADYRIETNVDGAWTEVRRVGDPNFTANAYVLPPNSEQRFEIGFEWLYGELPDGTYRLVKDIMESRGAGEYTQYTYYAEFTVRD